MSSDWRVSTWGQLGTLEYGKAIRDYQNATGNFPVYGTNGPIGWHDKPLCPSAGVVIGRKGAYRGIHYSSKPFFVIDTAFYLKPKEALDTKWAYYCLLTYDINGMDSGSAIPSTSRDEFYKLPVRVPRLEEQSQIANTLSLFDDRIALLRETNATLEAVAQALFKSWFIDFDPVRAKMEGRVPEGMDEATAALFPDSFEESELGLVPMGWRVGSFSDVCDISSGKRPLDRSDLVSDLYPIPLYGGAGIMGYTSIPLFDDLKILTGRVGTLGKVHIAYPPFWASDNVLVVTPKDQSCFSVVLHWLRSIDVLALNRGSTQPLLTQRDLGAQRGVIPPSHVVAEFEEVVELLYQRIQEQEVQVQTLASLRDTLLPRLISGQVRLSEI